jgi:cytidine deaminase
LLNLKTKEPQKLDPKTKKLISSARKARLRAYAPYSHFKVGASLISSNGLVSTGCNVENGSFGGTICAERTAIVKAVSESTEKLKLKTIVVVADHTSAVPPCGLCLQVMSEFCGRDTKVWLASSKKIFGFYYFSDLLPIQFKF